MFCPSCGTSQPGQSGRYCTRCGKAIPAEAAAPPVVVPPVPQRPTAITAAPTLFGSDGPILPTKGKSRRSAGLLVGGMVPLALGLADLFVPIFQSTTTGANFSVAELNGVCTSSLGIYGQTLSAAAASYCSEAAAAYWVGIVLIAGGTILLLIGIVTLSNRA